MTKPSVTAQSTPSPWRTVSGGIAITGVMILVAVTAFDSGLFAWLISHTATDPAVLDIVQLRYITLLTVAVIALIIIVAAVYRSLRRFRSAQTSSGIAMLSLLVLLAATAWAWRDVPANWQAYEAGERPLKGINSWYYHLGKINVEQIARSNADMLVIDFARNDGRIPLTREEVARVARRRDGRKRLVISYLSIGEAESYRFYWQQDWTTKKPAWHMAENCAWPRNHLVRFWHEDWKRIMFSGPKSYLKRIIDAGFDGVYLDRVDVFGELLQERPSARADMISFVAELTALARRLKPGFIVIAQNAEDLLDSARYRSLLDGLGKEDLLYGQDATGVRNSTSQIWRSAALIRKLQWEFKPVFAVEYLTTKTAITQADIEMRGRGLVPTFAHRDLDGSDPTKPHTASQEIYGTPEWIATQCDAKGKPYW